MNIFLVQFQVGEMFFQWFQNENELIQTFSVGIA